MGPQRVLNEVSRHRIITSTIIGKSESQLRGVNLCGGGRLTVKSDLPGGGNLGFHRSEWVLIDKSLSVINYYH